MAAENSLKVCITHKKSCETGECLRPRGFFSCYSGSQGQFGQWHRSISASAQWGRAACWHNRRHTERETWQPTYWAPPSFPAFLDSVRWPLYLPLLSLGYAIQYAWRLVQYVGRKYVASLERRHLHLCKIKRHHFWLFLKIRTTKCLYQ